MNDKRCVKHSRLGIDHTEELFQYAELIFSLEIIFKFVYIVSVCLASHGARSHVWDAALSTWQANVDIFLSNFRDSEELITYGSCTSTVKKTVTHYANYKLRWEEQFQKKTIRKYEWQQRDFDGSRVRVRRRASEFTQHKKGEDNFEKYSLNEPPT